ncbi:hypothetical protein [Halosegnis longus]|uniref:hypothetical protein n=1 Tax=Halosegnis longus TaxID=2216012 RepID=UPI0013141D40
METIDAVLDDVVTVVAIGGAAWLGTQGADPTTSLLAVAGLGGYRVRSRSGPGGSA